MISFNVMVYTLNISKSNIHNLLCYIFDVQYSYVLYYTYYNMFATLKVMVNRNIIYYLVVSEGSLVLNQLVKVKILNENCLH